MTGGPHYLLLKPESIPPDIAHLAPFKCVVVLDATYSADWQEMVSRWLIDQGCRYMMAWGPACSSFHDSVDFAEIEKFLPVEGPPDSSFVMTTWHDDEFLEEVFWYAQFCANFTYDDVEIPHSVILHIGEHDREQELIALFNQSSTLAERQPNPQSTMEKKGWLRRLFGA